MTRSRKITYFLIFANAVLFTFFAFSWVQAAAVTKTVKNTSPAVTKTVKNTTPATPKIIESNVNPPKDCLKDNGTGLLVPCSEKVYTPSVSEVPTSSSVIRDCLKDNGAGLLVPCSEAVFQPSITQVPTSNVIPAEECLKDNGSGLLVPCSEAVYQPTVEPVKTSAVPVKDCQRPIDDSGVTEPCNENTNSNLPTTGPTTSSAEVLPVSGINFPYTFFGFLITIVLIIRYILKHKILKKHRFEQF